MSFTEPSPGGVAAALGCAARARPEAPFLFYRDPRGQFRWWSFSTAFGFLEGGGLTLEKLSVKGVVVDREAVELLGGFLRVALGDGSEASGAADLPGPEPRLGRDVWISWRPLSHPREIALARWAIGSGAAILVEPGRALHPELFAWARPTIVSGSVEELLALASQLESLAPRFFRQRWFRQRAERLRLVLVAGEPAAGELEQVRQRWREMSARFSARVTPFAAGSLV
ncbi:MAG: hypothetical protein ABI689_13035 [Thermoanaerobaculia bacterium]